MSLNFPVRFADNVSELKANLASGLDSIEVTRAAVDRLSKSLSGENAIRSAHNWAAALQELGGEAGAFAGVEKLTFQEIERANASIGRAVDKYLALGQAIPEPIAQLHQLLKAEVDAGHAAEAAAKNQDTFASSLSKINGLLGGFGLALSVGAVVSFAKAILDDADSLVKMSDKTDISIESLERWKIATDDAGNTVEELTGAVNKMQKNLATGNPEALAAIERIGLSFSTLRAQKPEDQFESIATAIRGIKDPADQVAAAVAIFGKSGAELLPTIKRGFDDIHASIPSADTIRALDDVGDSITSIWRVTKELSAISLVGLMDWAVPGAKAMRELRREMEEVEKSLGGARKAAEAAAPKFGVLVPPGLPKDLEDIDKEWAKQEPLLLAAAKAAEKHAQALSALREEFSGKGLLEKAKDYETTIKSIGGIERLSVDEKQKLVNEFQKLIDKYRAFGPAGRDVVAHFSDLLLKIQPVPQKLLDIESGFHGNERAIDAFGLKLTPTMQDLSRFASTADLQRIKDLELGFGGVGKAVQDMGLQIKPTMNDIGQGLTVAKGKTSELSSVLGTLSNDFAQLATIGGGAFSVIARDIGFAVKGAEELGKVTDALDKISSTEKGGGFNAANLAALAAGWVGVAVVVYQLAKAFQEASDNAAKLRAQADFADKMTLSWSTSSRFSGQLSDQLQTLAEDLKRTFGLAPISAYALKIEDIIQELGGLGALTKDQLASVEYTIAGRYAGNMFDIIAKGGVLGAQATQSLNAVLVDMGTTFAANGGIVDKFFLDTAKHAHELGIELKGVQEFMQAQASSAETGLGAALKITNDAYAKRKDLLAQIDKETDPAKIEAMNASLKTQQQIIDATGIHSQAAAEAVSNSLLGIVSSQVAAGQSFGEAIRAVAPSMDSLRAQLQAMGISGGAAFDFLQTQATLFTDDVSGPALTAIEGYAQGLVGLNNAGLLNQDTFAGTTEQIGLTEQALESQGVNGKALLIAMQSPLQKLWELEQEFGYKADDATQALIDQAVADGEVGEKHKSVSQQMLDATKTMTNAVVFLAKQFGYVGDESKTAANKITDSFSRIHLPTIHVPVEYPAPPDWWNAGNPDWVPDLAPTGGVPPNAPSYASGSQGIRDFGLGTLAMLHGREAVITEAELRSGSSGRYTGAYVPADQSIIVQVHHNTIIDGAIVEHTVTRHQDQRFVKNPTSRSDRLSALGLV